MPRSSNSTTLALLAGFHPAAAEVVNFTAAEGYLGGNMLKNHPDWIGDDAWTASSLADSVISGSTGVEFAHYRGEFATNQVGDRFMVGATFKMVGFYSAPPSNLFNEDLFGIGFSQEVGFDVSPTRFGATLGLNDEPNPDRLEFSLRGAVGSLDLGPQSNFIGHHFRLEVHFTKQDETTYTMAASLDSLSDAAPAYEIPPTTIVPVALSSGPVYGIMESGPASGVAFGGIEVEQFTFEPVQPDLVPSTPVADTGQILVRSIQLGIEEETTLQTMTGLAPGVWNAVTASQDRAGPVTVNYLAPEGFTNGAGLFRLIAEAPDLFSHDFEDGSALDWTATTNGGPGTTAWELGTPNLNTVFANLNAAASGVNCWGTDLDSTYAANTDISLTSPSFTLPTAGPLNLAWMEWTDLDGSPAPGDQGFVRLHDLTAATSHLLHTTTGANNTWSSVSALIPASAHGHEVQIEFQFVEDGDPSSGWGGWYIDDVAITE